MAQVVLSEQDERRIEQILDELAAQAAELVSSSAPDIDDACKAFVLGHIRTNVRASLEIGLIARAVAGFARDNDLCDERGADHFLRSKAWVRNFGVPQTGDEYFYALSARYGARLGRCLDAVIEMAQDRLFGTMDEEYRRLFPAGS